MWKKFTKRAEQNEDNGCKFGKSGRKWIKV
jgi:hypothetical protein